MGPKRAFAALAVLFISTLAPASAQTAERPYPVPPSPTLEGMLEIGVRVCSAIIDGAPPAEAAAVHGITLSSIDGIQPALAANSRHIVQFFASAPLQTWTHVERAFADQPERRNNNLRYVTLLAAEDGSKCHVGVAGQGDIGAALARGLSAGSPWQEAGLQGGVLLVDTWRGQGNGSSFVDVRMTRRTPGLNGPNILDAPVIR